MRTLKGIRMKPGLCIVFALAWIGSVHATPIATWIDPQLFPAQMQVGLSAIVKNICIPDNNDIKVPIYPDADLAGVIGGRRKPQCALPGEWKTEGGIVLYSKDDPIRVVQWYRRSLRGFHAYGVNGGVIFSQLNLEKFCWNRDYGKAPSIFIERMGKNDPGSNIYKTIIDYVRPAL